MKKQEVLNWLEELPMEYRKIETNSERDAYVSIVAKDGANKVVLFVSAFSGTVLFEPNTLSTERFLWLSPEAKADLGQLIVDRMNNYNGTPKWKAPFEGLNSQENVELRKQIGAFVKNAGRLIREIAD